jgi:hypothetical protein
VSPSLEQSVLSLELAALDCRISTTSVNPSLRLLLELFSSAIKPANQLLTAK